MPVTPIMTVDEVAEALKLDRSTVIQWIKDGKLEALKPGKSWLILTTSFDALLSNTTTVSSPRSKRSSKIDWSDDDQVRVYNRDKGREKMAMIQEYKRDKYCVVCHTDAVAYLKVVERPDPDGPVRLLRYYKLGIERLRKLLPSCEVYCQQCIRQEQIMGERL